MVLFNLLNWTFLKGISTKVDVIELIELFKKKIV